MLQNMRKGTRQTNALGKQQEVPFLLHMDKNKYQTHKHSHFLSICYMPSRAPSTTTLFQFHRREVAVPILQVRNQDSNKTNHNLKELKRKGLNPCLSDTNSFGIFFSAAESHQCVWKLGINEVSKHWTVMVPDGKGTFVPILHRLQLLFHRASLYPIACFSNHLKASLLQLRHLYLSLIRFVLSS